MPRLPRIHIERGLYYVETRGDHDQHLFRDDADHEKYLELLSGYKNQYNFSLYAFMLIQDYVKLLIELSSGTTISQLMHDINSSYTKYFNSRYVRKGHLFQERFRAMVVEKDLYLKKLTAYIHLLPREKGLIERLEDYPWTSYRAYMGQDILKKDLCFKLKIDSELILDSFSKDAAESRRAYKDFVESLERDKVNPLEKKLSRGRILGSEGFMGRVKKEFEKGKSSEPSSHAKINITKAVVTILVLLFIGGYFVVNRMTQLKDSIEKASINKESALERQLQAEKESVRKSVEEKYRADMISYEALSKRLMDIENEKIREIK